MKKSLILIVGILVLAVLAGCNADQISGFGKGMEGLSDLGLGQKKNESMNVAIENVKAYVETTEEYFTWPDSMDLDPEMGIRKTVTIADKEGFISSVDSVVNKLLAAKESSAGTKKLRAALDAPYEGKGKDAVQEGKDYHVLYYGLREQSLVGGLLLRNFEDPTMNPGWIAEQLGMTIEAARQLPEKLKGIRLPFVLLSVDVDLLLGVLGSELQSIREIMKNESSGSDPKTGQSVLDVLKQFQKDVLDNVGDRKTATVGDKIASGILFCTLSTIANVNDAYRLSPMYQELPENHKYDKFGDYILKDPNGINYFDKILNYLDAIGFIYDAKLDIAGLASGLI